MQLEWRRLRTKYTLLHGQNIVNFESSMPYFFFNGKSLQKKSLQGQEKNKLAHTEMPKSTESLY